LTDRFVVHSSDLFLATLRVSPRQEKISAKINEVT
jgi:hypothetical protein